MLNSDLPVGIGAYLSEIVPVLMATALTQETVHDDRLRIDRIGTCHIQRKARACLILKPGLLALVVNGVALLEESCRHRMRQGNQLSIFRIGSNPLGRPWHRPGRCEAHC